MDLLLHTATHTPHPWHTPSFTLASIFKTAPCLFLTSSFSIAVYGHATRQSQHALQVILFTFAVIGSRAIWSLEKSARTLLAVALPIETDSGISIGPAHVPARKIPAVTVSTGFNFG